MPITLLLSVTSVNYVHMLSITYGVAKNTFLLIDLRRTN